METREVAYTGKDTIKRGHMSEVSETVDEVVVTGYQRIRKTDMVGSTNTVKREDMFCDGTNSLEQMLQGKLPGVVVMNTGGLVGTRQKVTRTRTFELYLVIKNRFGWLMVLFKRIHFLSMQQAHE